MSRGAHVHRAIVAARGTIAVAWPIDRVIDAGDAGTGLHVLGDLYARCARATVDVDLEPLSPPARGTRSSMTITRSSPQWESR